MRFLFLFDQMVSYAKKETGRVYLVSPLMWDFLSTFSTLRIIRCYGVPAKRVPLCFVAGCFMSSPEPRTRLVGIAEQNVPSHSFTRRERETLEGDTSRWHCEDSRRGGASRCAMLPRRFGPEPVKLPWLKQSRRPLPSCPPYHQSGPFY